MDLFTEDVQKQVGFIKANYNEELPLILWVDLFCGCGGVTEGYSQNENNFIVACVNHDPYAIKSHQENHPHCVHYTEDITDWSVIWKIQSLIEQLMVVFPEAYIGLHASLECTHFSKAKGGLSRDADSRTLGFHLKKYVKAFKVDYLTIENVEEFLSWCRLRLKSVNSKSTKNYSVLAQDKNNTYIKVPDMRFKSEFYNLWKEELLALGYDHEYKILNACDFAAYTSRRRYFGIFAADGLPIRFPKPTHVSKKKKHLFPNLKIHNPVRDKLNLLNEGRSIFGLTKQGNPYAEATFWRVYHGLIKFHKEGYFMVRYNGGDPKNKSKSISEPLGAILTNNTHSLVQPIFLTSYYGQSKDGNGVHSLEEPCNTLTTKDRFALHHIQYAYGKATYSKIDEPGGTITTNPKHELVTTKWLFDTQFNRVGNSINKPCPTIIARQDKKPLYLASTINYSPLDNSIAQEDDNEVKRLLRAFMRENGITDIKIRSLEVDELLRIQGFPEDYVLKGGKTRAKKYIGNSVCPPMAKAISRALFDAVKDYNRKVA